MRDLEALADMVTLTVKAALAPVLERLAAAEARWGFVPAAEKTLSDLRDRVLTVETKAAQPLQIPPAPDVNLVLAPLLERLAVSEAKAARVDALEQMVTDLRDRVVVAETKSAMPPAPDPTISQLRDRVRDLEAKAPMLVTEDTLSDMRHRVKALEDDETTPVTDPQIGDIRDRIKALELKSASVDPAVMHEITALRERVAVVEVKSPIVGPPGPPGKDGRDGKDGADGLGFEDMDVEQDGRTVTLKYERGHLKKAWPLTFPYMEQQGVYLENKQYVRGDVVTWAGSQWHCNEETTTKPGDGSKAWTLVVKRGRDGRDGKDAHEALPVVAVGRSG